MRYFAIARDMDVLTGLRLAGIEGVLVSTRREMEAALDTAARETDIAVLIVSQGCTAFCPETIEAMKLSAARPLVVVIPEVGETIEARASLTELIRDAIGVKI